MPHTGQSTYRMFLFIDTILHIYNRNIPIYNQESTSIEKESGVEWSGVEWRLGFKPVGGFGGLTETVSE